MKGIRVKLGWDGALYVDGGRLTPDGVEPFLHNAREEQAALILYREGVGRAPSDEQARTIEILKASGLELLHPTDAPPEWGPLQSFEMELTPSRFRISAEFGKDMLFSYMPNGGDKPLTYRFKGAGESALQNLDLMISSNRIVESKPHEPDLAFSDDTLELEGMHLRFSYGRSRLWQGWFAADAVPVNFENLYLGCRSLGLHVVKASVEEPPKEGNA